MADIGVQWIARRHEVRDRVFAFLKARCILVDAVERGAAIPRYRVSGKRDSYLLEEVVEYAESLGFEVPA